MQGNRNWIGIGSFTAQPSEVVKLGLVLGIGAIMYVKRDKLDDWKEVFIPVGIASLLSLGLVILGGDQGTAMIMLILVLGALYVGGGPAKHLLVGVVAMAVLLPFVTMASSSRQVRISAWLSGCTDSNQYADLCWQPCTACGHWRPVACSASGSATRRRSGRGCPRRTTTTSSRSSARNSGHRRVVWSALVLAVSMIKVIRQSKDPFVKTVTGGILAWIIGQALVNIAVVLGLLPVLGVPLPLISAGGSALIMTLVAIGVVLSFARDLPARTARPAVIPRRPDGPQHPERNTPVSTYLFAGGGTAGHVNPLLAVADRLTERDADAEVIVLGTAEGLESRLVPMRGYELLTIPRLPFPRKPNAAALRFPQRFWGAVKRTEQIIREHDVEVVLGVGGYAAAPAYIAAKRTGTPIVVHEQNAKPGLANRLAAFLTEHVGSPSRTPGSGTAGSSGCHFAARSSRSTVAPAAPRGSPSSGWTPTVRSCSSPAGRPARAASTAR